MPWFCFNPVKWIAPPPTVDGSSPRNRDVAQQAAIATGFVVGEVDQVVGDLRAEHGSFLTMKIKSLNNKPI